MLGVRCWWTSTSPTARAPRLGEFSFVMTCHILTNFLKDGTDVIMDQEASSLPFLEVIMSSPSQITAASCSSRMGPHTSLWYSTPSSWMQLLEDQMSTCWWMQKSKSFKIKMLNKHSILSLKLHWYLNFQEYWTEPLLTCHIFNRGGDYHPR